MLRRLMEGISRSFTRLGHAVTDVPDAATDLVLTTYRYGQSLGWRKALLFTMRRRFGLERTLPLFTLIHMTRGEFQDVMGRLEQALSRDPVRPEDFRFADLAPESWRVLAEQGQRGGPILALERVLQGQSKCIRLLLAIGEQEPEILYHFDLVGAHPTSDPARGEAFYDDIVLRMVTSACTTEVTDHQVVGPPVTAAEWAGATVPEAMRRAGAEIGRRGFFTNMIQVSDLIHLPSISDAVSSQYSEGCFSSWDPRLNALIATVTGSARPVDKGRLTDDDLAVIVGVTPAGQGAQVRHVEGHPNTPPSTEAVEMMEMDQPLPRIALGQEWGIQVEAPVIRSRLHGHRGVSAYDPSCVEFAPLDEPYYRYLVSCGTGAQAQGIRAAFARAAALNGPGDPRQVVFTVLPGHGVMIVEKWVPGKEPFQLIWEYMDAGKLVIDRLIPQGPMAYEAGDDGMMRLVSR
ncbi:MAG: hypothetical protein GXX94_11335 [Chloroflexi bacterium]|nr:hypothetical protein [Chloroflexota bacterium]